MSTEMMLALVGVFVLVGTSAAVLTSRWTTHSSVEQQRLRSLVRTSPSGLIAAPGGLATAAVPELPWAKWVPSDPKKLSRLQKRLARAGITSAPALKAFVIGEVAMPLVFGAAALAILGWPRGLLAAVAAAVLGYVAPALYLGHLTKRRQTLIRNGLPDGLDLLTVCVEAGSGLDQAIAKAADELRTSHPALADEFQAITTEIRAGKPRMDAFRSFADRTGLEDVRTLVSMLTQTDRFGTSIGEALRVHSDTLRTKRRQAAEERGAKIGVKLVFPLVLCLFPALYVVCFGPVVVQVYRVFIESR